MDLVSTKHRRLGYSWLTWMLVATCGAMATPAGHARAQVKPRFVLAVDTSGSMIWDAAGNTTYGDGVGRPAVMGDNAAFVRPGINGDVFYGCGTTAGLDRNCDGLPNDSRLAVAKASLRDILLAYGDVDWALARYHQTQAASATNCKNYGGTSACDTQTYGNPQCFTGGIDNVGCVGAIPVACRPAAGAAGTPTAPMRVRAAGNFNGCIAYTGGCPASTTADYGDILVGFPGIGPYFGLGNEYSLLKWVDDVETSYVNDTTTGHYCNHKGTGDCELRSDGATAIGGILRAVRTYMTPIKAADSVAACRGYYVIMLTDGEETCSTNPNTVAADLFNTYGIRVYVVGLAIAASSVTSLNAIAAAGGTTAAYFANDRTQLSAALSTIVSASLLTETCNGLDDDCDSLIDEGFTLYCDPNDAPPRTAHLCTEPAEPLCNGQDEDCDGTVDEGLLNACGQCGGPESCNSLDDDCDGLIDEVAGVPGQICNCFEEICNNLDDDCDGFIDDNVTRGCGTDVGECVRGNETCTAGVWGTCVGATGPTAETCDGQDDDCDGKTDEALVQSCGVTNTGACQLGAQRCANGAWEENPPGTPVCVGNIDPLPSELCNGIDDDCDGPIDEGNPQGGGLCGTSVGECAFGALACQGGSLVCVGGIGPTTELCNGDDDDCDGAIDNGNPGGGAACGTDTGQCTPGTELCVLGSYVCQGSVGPVPEACNSLDDDCDGPVDETFPNKGTQCGSDVGQCSSGTLQCPSGSVVCQGSIGPITETCNTFDDDCDGAPDDNVPSSGPCGTDTGQCTPGAFQCVGGSFVCQGGVTSVPEVCNTFDDDCDGPVDEGNPGGGGACGTDVGECVAGTVQCMLSGPLVGTLDCVGDTPSVTETCDNLDNDCDGVIDDGNPGGNQVCGVDTGECQSGLTLCVFGNYVCQGEVGSIAERCDNLDNDCNGVIDNGNPEGGGICGSSIGECAQGTLQCLGGALDCVGDIVATTEICDGLDNDCDGIVDDGNPGGGAVCGTGAGVCQPGTLLCVFGTPAAGAVPENYVCQGQIAPVPERCNGLDDDCDGTPDDGDPESGGPCGSNVGRCVPGVYHCVTGALACQGAMGPFVELCNLLDDDCDGKTDEANPEGGAVCGVATGECQTGIVTCLGGDLLCSGEVTPVPELCNGLDDDCDGTPDDGNPEGGGLCGTDVGQCVFGTLECLSGALDCVGETGPSAETCDGEDDDCDGVVDDGNPGGGAVCGIDTGACQSGTELCVNGDFVCQGSVGPVPEVCNSSDDNCNGPVDEGDPGGGGTCGSDVGECVAGILHCVSGGLDCIGDVGPVAEVCDGLDNNCNGIIDDGIPLGALCGTDVGECQTGNLTCINGTFQCAGNIGPVPELCNGLDDNCNGIVDGNNPQGGGDCGTDIGECSFGVVTCTDAELECFGGVGPVTEVCDGKDNNCDGVVDDGNPGSGAVCGTDVGECKAGVRACVQGGFVCEGEITPEAERCDGKDNNCNGATDEGNPGGGLECGVSTGICATGHTACVAGIIECPDDIEPLPAELCNGDDDDCDGKTDEGNPGGGGACGDVGLCRTGPAGNQPCGECEFGADQCVGGALVCVGATGPRDERCNGRDDDCDLAIDEGVTVTDPNIGQACGVDVGECSSGTTTCMAGLIVCGGGQGPVAEICDGKDNDCDGVKDEGIPIGAPCGTDVGECQPGHGVCDVAAGKLICQGAIEPVDEICDALDNDCDGDVDEELSLGGPCGTDEGLCEKGTEECVGGSLLCVGEIPPGPEFCDCEDNDCDGNVDEVTAGGNLCPGTSMCVSCQCALPCTELGEFGLSCPTGKVPLGEGKDCYCVGQRCKDAECAETTLERDGAVLCEPMSVDVGACACKQNECTFPCDGVVCTSGTVCNPLDGTCQKQSCLLPQFRCASDERCDPASGMCESDPCADANCKATEACRAGKCVKSCADVTCSRGEDCVDGACEKDPCSGVSCPPGQACNPADGECIKPDACLASGCGAGTVCDIVSGCTSDPCLALRCPGTETCVEGQCASRCGPGFVSCEEVCVDASSNRKHCGASGDCLAGNAGTACADGEVCNEGTCGTTCSEGRVNCGGECVIPETSFTHCGASADCMGDNAGVSCKANFQCREGKCVANAFGIGTEVPDAGPDGSTAGGGGASKDPNRRVLATGGGGLGICAVASVGASDADAHRARMPFALALACIALLLRRRSVRAPRLARWARTVVATGVLASVSASVALLGGCKVSPFCLDCVQGDSGPQGPGGGSNLVPNQSGDGETPFPGQNTGNGDAATPDGGKDGSVGGPGSGCIDHELCNGADDDCDGKSDEGIDTMRDPNNCGGCDQPCAPANAIGTCEAGGCGLGGCDVGFLDLDGEPTNGCEYRCFKTQSDDTICDLRDNDCDGHVDEEVDFLTDPNNCGSCGFVCRFAHAADGSTCFDGKCELDPKKCDPGFHDVDDKDATGCEYACDPATPPDERCDGLDDDCDGTPDEGVEVTDPDVGDSCGTDTGRCVAGTTVCMDGAVQCEGTVGPTTETCNTKDDDCDGDVDESDPNMGVACGESRGLCENGLTVCVAGMLECQGGTGAVDEACDGLDNDCDGKTDEGNPESGMSCGVTDTGECVLGVTTCSGGVKVCLNEVGPVDEVCNGKNDDCDVNTDEGNPGGGAACGNAIGECEAGTVLCQGGMLVCDGGVGPAPMETCDGLDNDCDGKFDEGNPGGGATCGTATGECAEGMMRCISGSVVCSGAVNGTLETCNGKDDDCDGAIDDGNPGGGASCGSAVGICEQGTVQCLLSGPQVGTLQCVGATPPAANEACDTLDNDCDAKIDEGNPGGGATCGTATGECAQGTLTCTSGSVVCAGGVNGSNEICDGLDNDCDGFTDESTVLNPLPGVGANCGNGVGECSQGMVACVSTGPTTATLQCVGATLPAANDTCDGLDNDCDAKFDEGNPGGGAACGTNEGECSQGTLTCVSGSVVCVGAVNGTNEICDGQDDDCDAEIDENTMADPLPGVGAACGSSLGECAQGMVECVPTGPTTATLQCVGATLPAANEACDSLDNDCDGKFDEGNPGGGGTCGTDTGACVSGTLLCAGGPYICQGSVVAQPETCNNVDEDCDGTTDETTMLNPLPGVGAACGAAVGNCTQGTIQCVTGALDCVGAGGGSAETCDGEDEDCDGSFDEDNPGGGAICGTDVGACQSGVQVCVGATYQCQGQIGGSTEICNGIDDDCDNSTDENNPGGGGPCGTNAGECVAGTVQCQGVSGLVCVGATGPTAEACDGQDDDCDGKFDEGNPGGGASCGISTGECATGVEACLGGSIVCTGAVGASPELCDGLDNDCNGVNDNGVATTDTRVGQICGTDVGECNPGTRQCQSGALVCVGATGGTAEVCDGQDDDCDGGFDEGDPGGGASCGSSTGECAFGTFHCVAGSVACQGGVTPLAETCNAKDDDCDFGTDEGNPGGGASCGTDVGECSTGTMQCALSGPQVGTLVCVGAVGGGAETCDGQDDDCDGQFDEGNPGGGASCGSGTGECAPGAITCVGGSLQCQGAVGPTLDVCDSLDNDCDAMADEDFDTMNGDIDNCGGCGPGPSNIYVCDLDHAVPECVDSTCEILACDPGWVDADGLDSTGCELECTVTGNEVCDGEDNDCDGVDDDSPSLPPPSFCGVDTGECVAGTPTCSGGAVTCPGHVAPSNETCDNQDDDCDGKVDENFSVGQTCSVGVGACVKTGMIACTGAASSACSETVPGSPVNEACNDIDDDCDGATDETTDLVGDADGVGPDDLATINVGGGLLVFQYEASRPDASPSIPGGGSALACSTADRIPWTNVTWPEARDACCALNPTGNCTNMGGWRLCDAGTWQSSCASPSGTCLWGYTTACSTRNGPTSAAQKCNGEEYDCNSMIGGDQDCLLSTGNAAFPGCGAAWGGGNIYDMSGNAKEWTNSQPANGLFQIRGGSYNNVEFGRRCVYDFTVGDDVFSFQNTGFRCCYYPTPVTTCFTYTSTDVPKGIAGGALSGTLNSTIDVAAGGLITDINLTTTGTTLDFRDLQFTLKSPANPGGVSVVPFLSCSGSPDNWSFTFDDESSGSPCSMLGPPVGNGGTYDPIAGSLTTFDNTDSTGTWTLTITDNDATSATPSLTTWSLNICIQQ